MYLTTPPWPLTHVGVGAPADSSEPEEYDMADVKPQRLTLREFQQEDVLRHVADMVGSINGGTFMGCHKALFEATGIWIDELVPVFQKLDAALATRDLRPALG